MNLKTVSHSPHLKAKGTTSGIMLDVVIALVPASIMAIIYFGPLAIAQIAVGIVSAMLSEYICCKVMKKKCSVGNLSSVVTGLLLALNVPVSLPVWMTAIGAAVAIVVVKMMFGGLGQNFANPAIVGRIVLLVSFATAMTTYTDPFAWFTRVDAVSGPTPLATDTYSYLDLFIGNHSGVIGETCAAALILGGLYLVIRRVITPTIPLSFIGTVFVFSFILGIDPLYAILSGGVMLGAIFMATDYVTSPHNFLGKLIFGIGCGVITVVIRRFGSLPEGVSYAILLMNLLTPHIEKLTAPKPFGWEAKKNG